MNLRCQVSLQRECAGRAEGLIVFDFELLAEPGMFLEAAARPNCRADLQTSQASYDGYRPGVAAPGVGFDHRNRIAVLFVNVQDMVERTLNRRLDLCGTSHNPRIALPAKHVK